jgi:large subunit ribosomal protein L29
MKRQDDLREIRELDEEGRLGRLSSLEQELMSLRFKHASGQLEQTAQLGILRKRIGRVKTIINQDRKSEAVAAE